jgi:hypothetical protein
MAGFSTIKDYVDCQVNGRIHSCVFRKVPSQASTAGWWVDLSMAAGNPMPNYYVGTELEATLFDDFRGIFHGDDKSPSSKHLTSLSLITPTAAMVGKYMLLDYLMFYPFVDGDSADAQTMDNTITLPRYATGDGVQVMAVAVAPTTGSGRFTFDYINQDGVAKTSKSQSCSTTSANIATLVTSQQANTDCIGPFLSLNSGDTGVRSITSVTFTVANGGLVALVLVKPIAEIAIREINTEVEATYVDKRPGILPRIYDGAYLNLISNPAGSVAAGILKGAASFAWST